MQYFMSMLFTLSRHKSDVLWVLNHLISPASLLFVLTHSNPWYIHTSVNMVIIGSGNGLSPVRRQVTTWTSAGTVPIGRWGLTFSGNC